MPDVEIKITNLPQIKAAFLKSPTLMTRNLNEAIQKSIFKVGQQSRMNTPVDTGRLRASHYEQFSSLKGEVGTDTEYDIFVHEGTRFMSARPYLKTAVEDTARTIDDYFQDAVQKTLDEIGSSI